MLQLLPFLMLPSSCWSSGPGAGAPVHLRHSEPTVFLTSLKHGITKMIHQSWKSHDLRPDQAEWRESWHRNHPYWIHKLWTDSENYILIKESFPWLLNTYTRLPHEIFRADIARYAYMFIFGGVYVDLDFESIKPLEELLQNASLALAYDIRSDNGGSEIANAFMASAPGHPFWIHVLTSIVERAHGSTWQREKAIMETGPGALSRAYNEWSISRSKGLPIYVVPPGLIYPTQKHKSRDPCRYYDQGFDPLVCKAEHPDAYALTYWTGSWYQ